MSGKYGAKPVVIDGIRFASKAEGKRYQELVLLLRAGEISDLVLQPKFVLVPAVRLGNRTKPALRYTADFQYFDKRLGRTVVIDVKGAKSTEAFRMRAHLMKHVHNIEVEEYRG